MKENIKNANATKPEEEESDERKTADEDDKEDKADKAEKDDDEVQVEDPSEDVKEAEEGAKGDEINELEAKLGGTPKEEETTEPTEVGPKFDYSLLDSLCGFLYEDEDPLPILCGYFLRIMEQLLDKQKHLIL